MRTVLRLAVAVLVAAAPSTFATAMEASTMDAGILGSVSVGSDSRMSAAIYDEHSQLVLLRDLIAIAARSNGDRCPVLLTRSGLWGFLGRGVLRCDGCCPPWQVWC